MCFSGKQEKWRFTGKLNGVVRYTTKLIYSLENEKKNRTMYSDTISAWLKECVGRIQPLKRQFPASTTQTTEALFMTWKSLINNFNG